MPPANPRPVIIVLVMAEIRTLFPPGHFYSPICDPSDLLRRQDVLWPQAPPQEREPEDPSIDYNIARQLELLARMAPYVPEIDFPIDPPADPTRYYYRNDQYPCLDAEVLFCMIRHTSPAKIVEVGSGFSTLIMAEVNRRFYDSTLEIACIEPYPRQFLIDGVPGVSQLIRQPVQSVSPSVFDFLTAGDILFIDSSHVSKTGSDVNHLLFNILPFLKEGVYVHFHDIFLPDEYPKRWAIEEGRNWNEQYLVRAFLQFNSAFEIVWGSYLMITRYPTRTVSTFPRCQELGAGGSLWLRRRKPNS